MTPLCTEADVLARPALVGVTLNEAQTASIPGYIEEASALIAATSATTSRVQKTIRCPTPRPSSVPA